MKGFILASLLVAVLAVGCASGEQTAPGGAGTAGQPKASGFKVALLTPGPVSDAGWSALAYRGLEAIQKELGAEVNNQQANDAQIRDAMRSYAQKGYALVIGHGFEYNDPAIEVAKDFPGTVFVSSSGGKTAKNVGTFRFALEQGFYLAGMTAGFMTKTGTVAMIGGPEVPSIKSTFAAFKAGAEAAKPGIKVIEAFTGSNDDIAKANQATLAAIGQGADFVIHQANAAAQGVFDACKEKGVMAFGANFDQNAAAPDTVVASAVIVADPAFVDLAKSVKDGKYVGEVQTFDMAKGAIDYVWNPKLKDKVPSDVVEKVTSAAADIKSGKLSVPMAKF